MKIKNKKTILISALILLALVFFIFNRGFNFTGNVVLEEINSSNYTITKQQAEFALNSSEELINKLSKEGISVNYLNDTLAEAKIIFKQVEYVEIIKNTSSTEKEKQEAKQALRLIRWQNLSYKEVILYTEEIKVTQERILLLLDTLSLEEKKIIEYSETTKTIFNQANLAFFEERYIDAEKLLEDLKLQMEKENAEASTLNEIKNATKNFFQKYWLHLLVFLALMFILFKITHRFLEKKLLARKIKRMKIEENVLGDLLKKAQEERFKENKISGLVYNIRSRRYQEKIQEIKEELPVLEARLKKEK
jgi:broad-specificity NMP kinase